MEQTSEHSAYSRKDSRIKRILKNRRFLISVASLIVLFFGGVVFPRFGEEFPAPATDRVSSRHATVALFGATGRVGTGILEAMMDDTAVERIHVVTRRPSARIEEGMTKGLVEMTTHLDYLDYTAIRSILAEVDAVYWALGTSAMNVTDDEYTVIHVDFPLKLVREWLDVRGKDTPLTFHLVSGAGAAPDAMQHWAREKARVEKELFELAGGTRLRVISYRPGAVIPSGRTCRIPSRGVPSYFSADQTGDRIARYRPGHA